MPLYDFRCLKCDKVFEGFLKLENYKDNPLCECGGKTEKAVTLRLSEPSFTEKLYPYYDQSLNQRFDSKHDRQRFLKANGYSEVPQGSMTRKQERQMYNLRIDKVDPRKMKYVGR